MVPAVNRERKWILIGGMILLLMGAFYRFYPEMESLLSASQEIETAKMQLDRYRQIAGRKEAITARYTDLKNRIEQAEKGLLAGTTPAIVAVEIQNILNEIAGKSKLTIHQMQILKEQKTESGAYLRVPVQVTIDSTVRELKDMLYGIETFPKVLKVTQIQIRAQQRGRGFGRVQSTITVTGFMKMNRDGSTA